MAFVMTQKEIDRHTYQVRPHQLVEPLRCDQCGSEEVARLVSYTTGRGRMFLVARDDPSFDSSAVLAFCAECWPRWMMWRARMGFDLHTHAASVRCDRDCLAQGRGRLGQFEGQMTLLGNRVGGDGFFACKAIDGQPRVNGTPSIFGARMAHFMYRMYERQKYYESTSDPAVVKRLFLDFAALREAGVSKGLDGILIIVEAFESWRTAKNGEIALPGPGDKSIGLHCVFLTHYKAYGEILGFANNWGRGWGKRGYGTLSFEYLEKHLHEAHIIRHARWGPRANRFRETPGPLTMAERRRRSRIGAPRRRFRERVAEGESRVIETYETSSPTTGRAVICVDVQNGFGLRMGWMFLRYRPEDKGAVMEIPELFVWPTFRGMGIGRELEEIAQDIARLWNCSELHLMMNEADAILSLRGAARNFGQALGYKWRWRDEVAPRRLATGLKRL
jgi:GNAT superfamily N-acetyltransferase